MDFEDIADVVYAWLGDNAEDVRHLTGKDDQVARMAAVWDGTPIEITVQRRREHDDRLTERQHQHTAACYGIGGCREPRARREISPVAGMRDGRYNPAGPDRHA